MVGFNNISRLMEVDVVVRFLFMLALVFSGALFGEEKVIRVGLLPSGDSFCVFWAHKQGYFKELGLAVELVEFSEAQKRDSALIGGSISVANGDLIGTSVMRANKAEIAVVAQTLGDRTSDRLAAILVSDPKAKISDLSGKEFGISKNTIIEYMFDRLLAKAGVDANAIKVQSVPDLPMRLMLVQEKKIFGVMLPDPLASFAESQGGKVLLDNRGTIYAHAVLVMAERFVKENPQSARLFLQGMNRAISEINQAPEKYRAAMAERSKVPKAIENSFFLYHFAHKMLPSEELFNDVQSWLLTKRKTSVKLGYKDLIVTL